MKGRKAPLFFTKMGRDLIVNVDELYVSRGIKRYRGQSINEDLLHAGTAELLISQGTLTDPTVEVTPEPIKKPKKNTPK